MLEELPVEEYPTMQAAVVGSEMVVMLETTVAAAGSVETVAVTGSEEMQAVEATLEAVTEAAAAAVAAVVEAAVAVVEDDSVQNTSIAQNINS
jgi:hypothetical protein